MFAGVTKAGRCRRNKLTLSYLETMTFSLCFASNMNTNTKIQIQRGNGTFIFGNFDSYTLSSLKYKYRYKSTKTKRKWHFHIWKLWHFRLVLPQTQISLHLLLLFFCLKICICYLFFSNKCIARRQWRRLGERGIEKSFYQNWMKRLWQDSRLQSDGWINKNGGIWIFQNLQGWRIHNLIHMPGGRTLLEVF